MSRELLEWVRREDKPARADDEDWTLHKPDLSLAIWKAMEATSWQHLPFPGNLLDQPDWLIHDLFVIAWRKEVIRNLLKSPLRGRPGKAFGG